MFRLYYLHYISNLDFNNPSNSLNLHVRIPIHYLLCFATNECCHPCYIFRLRDQLVKLGEEFHGFLTNPKYIVRFMNAGRLIRVSYILQFSQDRVHWTLY